MTQLHVSQKKPLKEKCNKMQNETKNDIIWFSHVSEAKAAADKAKACEFEPWPKLESNFMLLVQCSD